MSVLGTPSRPGPDEAAILDRFGIGTDALIGAGGESRVFALDAERVLRVLGGPPDLAVVDLVRGWTGVDRGVRVPAVLEVGRTGGQHWTVDVRVPGESLAGWLGRGQREARRRAVLAEYLDVAGCLRRLPIASGGFRALFVPDAVPAGATLVELLQERAEYGMAFGGNLLRGVLPDLDAILARLWADLGRRDAVPAFVHNDYFPGNVMTDGERITGVIDVSVHALAADPVMDEVGAACFVELVDYPDAGADAAWLSARLAERLGTDAWLVDAYRRWYALYYSMDPALLDWSVAGLASSAGSVRSWSSIHSESQPGHR